MGACVRLAEMKKHKTKNKKKRKQKKNRNPHIRKNKNGTKGESVTDDDADWVQLKFF